MAGGQLPFGFAPQGELTAYEPTLREKAADWLRQKLFTDDRAGQDKANRLTNWGETMLPPFGFATSMYDMGRAGGQGDYGTAAMIGGMAMAPVPGSIRGIKAYHGSPPSIEGFVAREKGQNIGAENLSSITRDGHFYRGMTSDEYEATLGKGTGVKSANPYSLPGEGTSFAEDVPTAESYVNYGRDDPRITGKPTYLVEVAASPSITKKPDGYFHAQGEIMPTRVWEMSPDNGRITAKQLTDLVKKYGIAGASAMLGYNLLEGMNPAQADELKRIEAGK